MYVQTTEKRINADNVVWNGPLTGLVDRDGTLYPCSDYDHWYLAEKLGFNLDTLLIDAGWVHIGFAAGVYTHSRKHITQEQVNTLWDIRCATSDSSLQEDIERFVTNHSV